MWARTCEVVLGAWLVASPWVIEGSGVGSPLGGAVAAALGIASAKWERAHLGTLAVGVALMLSAYQGYPAVATAAEQNAMLSGFVLALLAIVPTRASPPSWR